MKTIASLGRKLAPAALLAAALMVAPEMVSAQVYAPNELTEMPKIENMSQAQRVIQGSYPATLRGSNVAGKVQIQFVVLEDGSVDPASISVVSATVQELGDAAVSAVKQIKFKPGKKDGTAVQSRVVIPIAYGGDQ